MVKVMWKGDRTSALKRHWQPLEQASFFLCNLQWRLLFDGPTPARDSLYVVATCTDFLVRGVVRRRRAFRGLKPRRKKIGRNVQTHSWRFPRSRSSDNIPDDEIGAWSHGITWSSSYLSWVQSAMTFPWVSCTMTVMSWTSLDGASNSTSSLLTVHDVISVSGLQSASDVRGSPSDEPIVYSFCTRHVTCNVYIRPLFCTSSTLLPFPVIPLIRPQ